MDQPTPPHCPPSSGCPEDHSQVPRGLAKGPLQSPLEVWLRGMGCRLAETLSSPPWPPPSLWSMVEMETLGEQRSMPDPGGSPQSVLPSLC